MRVLAGWLLLWTIAGSTGVAKAQNSSTATGEGRREVSIADIERAAAKWRAEATKLPAERSHAVMVECWQVLLDAVCSKETAVRRLAEKELADLAWGVDWPGYLIYLPFIPSEGDAPIAELRLNESQAARVMAIVELWRLELVMDHDGLDRRFLAAGAPASRIAVFENDPDPWIRALVVALAEYDPFSHCARCSQAMRDRSEIVRMAAITSLIVPNMLGYSPPAFQRLLNDALSDPSSIVASNALALLLGATELEWAARPERNSVGALRRLLASHVPPSRETKRRPPPQEMKREFRSAGDFPSHPLAIENIAPAAMTALGMLGPDARAAAPEILEFTIKRLGTAETEAVLFLAVSTLDATGPPSPAASRSLLSAIRRHRAPKPDVRSIYAAAEAYFDPVVAKRYRTELLQSIRVQNPANRLANSIGLLALLRWSESDASFAEAVSAGFGDHDGPLRLAALQALNRRPASGDAISMKLLEFLESADASVEERLLKVRRQAKFEAATWLWRLPAYHERARRFLTECAANQTDLDSCLLAIKALEALAHSDPAAESLLLEQVREWSNAPLLNEFDPASFIEVAAVRYLSTQMNARRFEALETLLLSRIANDVESQVIAIRIIDALGASSSAAASSPALRRALDTGPTAVRKAAAEALSQRGTETKNANDSLRADLIREPTKASRTNQRAFSGRKRPLRSRFVVRMVRRLASRLRE